MDQKIVKRIEDILDKEVRPYLEKHYGGVKLLRVDEGNVSIRLLGQCSNCPSANHTVENIIENALKKELPEIKKVIIDNTISEEILDMAKKMLRIKND